MGTILSILSSWVLTQVAKIKMFRSGLKEKHVDLRVRSSDSFVRAHYLERKADSRSSSNSEHPKDLLIIPGFTAHADMLLSDLVWAMKPNIPSGWRIVIMELPLHNKNVCNFDGKFPDFEDIKEYALAFIQAVGMGQNGVPLSLCGYSLGGNPCLRVLLEHPEKIDKVVLIAPAFPETRDSNFIELGRNDPRRIHAWQSLEEARFFAKSICGCHEGHLVTYDAALRGWVRQRRKTYGKHDLNFFAKYASAMGMLEKEPETTNNGNSSSGSNPLDPALLGKIQNPVLLVTGDRDICISSHKCQALISEAMGKNSCTFCELVDTGHYGGPRDGPPDSNIFYESAPVMVNFLFH